MQFQVYATPQTKAALHLEKIHPDFPAFLAGTAKRDLVILSTSELKALSTSHDDRIEALRNLLKFLPGFPFDRHMSLSGSSKNTAKNIDEKLYETLDAARTYAGRAVYLPSDTAGIIVYNDETTVLEHFAFLSGVPASLLGNMPNILSDTVHAGTLLHEAHHFLSRHNVMQETTSDIGALRDIFKLQAMGALLDPDYASYMEAIRAIGSLRKTGTFIELNSTLHATNLGFDIQGQSVKTTPFSHTEAQNSIYMINTRAFMLIGSTIPTDRQTAKPRSEPGASEQILAAQKNGPEAIAMIKRGEMAFNQNPLIFFAAIKKLYGENAFKGQPLAEKAAREFIAGFEKCIPSSLTSQDISDFYAKADKPENKKTLESVEPALQTFIKMLQEILEAPPVKAAPLKPK
jgi:hypothetical protein